ncbi:Group II intron, maturase-specific [Acididesulfobacillus acetoxydans]|uniref:Group II intron, maturase-specific n=1 Tax=Acididesulfobacillus acetoxydans TaxID=1561005 RepID=A0A8S0XVP8_9FIRM|nr:group II intron maturase-specific domain-containing protein [Acididesulfobacillus acetoxydans]CAA7600507.1 Group II intron, maturase-specific [Acididesulfobacillus acetoxydans]CEJ06641.1 Group II intron, maturase-specific domain [Acididesulfobacillus acetoxydans]
MGVEERKGKLNQIIRGWTNYFKPADARRLLETPDEWLPSRIRMVTWHQNTRLRFPF